MRNCQQSLQSNLHTVRESIRQTTTDWRERAFGFSDKNVTPIYLGDCDEVEKPTMLSQVGTFHTHTIENSKPSEDDFEAFLNSGDKLMCFARPIDELWSVRCYDRSVGVCAETELRGI